MPRSPVSSLLPLLHPSFLQNEWCNTPLWCSTESGIPLSHGHFYILIGVFHVQQLYLIWEATRLNGFPSEGLTADIKLVSSMWFFSFMLWHSKWAEWSVSQNFSDLCWKMFIFVTFKLFPWFCDWNKWIQMCTVYKIQWHHVMCGNDQQCLFHLAHRYFTFPVNFPYLYTTLNTFCCASWFFFSLPAQTWVKKQYFFSINIQCPLSHTKNRIEAFVQHDQYDTQ